MKRKKEVLKPAIFLAMAFLVLCASVSTVFADFGFHPTYVIKVRNAPESFYYAMLASVNHGSPPKGWNPEKENSELHLDHVDEESVKAYLEDFRYGEWYYNDFASGYKLSNPEKEITYSTHLYTPFRIIFIEMDGTVRLGPILQEWQSCFYDYQTGELSDYTGTLPRFIKYVVFCLLLTFIIEYSVFGAFGFAVGKKNKAYFWQVNVATNVPFTVALYWIAMNESNIFIFTAIFTILEVIIALIEAILYSRVLVDKNQVRRPKRAFICGLFANACSAICGAFFSMTLLAEYANW